MTRQFTLLQLSNKFAVLEYYCKQLSFGKIHLVSFVTQFGMSWQTSGIVNMTMC